MAQRIVYGRRTVIFDGAPYIIEMRTSGIWIRRKHYREKIRVSFETLLKYTKPQLSLPGLEFENETSLNGLIGTEVREIDSDIESGKSQQQ